MLLGPGADVDGDETDMTEVANADATDDEPEAIESASQPEENAPEASTAGEGEPGAATGGKVGASGNAPDRGSAHPSVWIVKDPKTRIACITLGHAAEAHGNPAFKTLLTNAVKWTGGR